MKVIRRTKKKQLLIAILALSLAVLIAGAILIDTLLQIDDGGSTDPVLPEILDGEAIYNNSAIAYPYVKEASITAIVVKGTEDEYSLVREEFEKDGKTTYGSFVLGYKDSYGDMQTYAPDIIASDSDTDYSDLYAIEGNDGYGTIPKLTYLCTAIGAPYFNERIELSSDEATRAEQLSWYGLTSSNSVSIGFTYVDESGEEKSHVVTIGGSVITGFGYYYLVDDRPYVYSVENNDYFSYALADFTTFVKPVLTAAGLGMDGAFEPYLTTDFQQWKNTLYDDNKPEAEDGDGVDTVIAGSTVTVNAALISPDSTKDGGYSKGKYKGVSFDLSDTAGDELIKFSLAALNGKPLGALSENLSVTLMNYAAAELLDADGIKTGLAYEYTVTAIESVLDESGEHRAEGHPVGSSKYVKVTYTARVNGGDPSATLHAIINMEEAILPASARAEISAASVGQLDTPIVFTVNYTEESSIERNIIITEIITILDSKNKALEKVVEGSSVMYRFKYEVNGVELDSYGTEILTVTSSLEGQDKLIADALMGKSQSKKLSIVIPDGNYQLMNSFISYDVSEICYFITRENIVSFRFQQASERNPYYGESLYENTMKGDYSMYALNATACESVVKMLGGIGQSSSQSLGISGLRTVAVGLTPEVMKEFGLYAYSVYFELPRGITTVKLGDSSQIDDYLNDLDDYTYYTTLGFNLYISEEFKGEDGKYYRYVGSDMYDIVALCNSADFEFLKYDFISFYARRNVMLTDISSIYNIKLEFLMNDIYGTYDNKFTHEQLYSYDGRLYTKQMLISIHGEDALATASPYDGIEINVTPSGDCMDTELSKFIEEKGYTSTSLYEFFDKAILELDSVGTSNFKELTEMIFYTYYEGYFESEEEKREAYENGEKLMVMHVTLGERNADGEYQTYGSYDYVYEFYRCSDRRVAVRLYRENRANGAIENEVEDFYISTFSFKKIVSAYVGILNKQLIDNDTPYT